MLRTDGTLVTENARIEEPEANNGEGGEKLASYDGQCPESRNSGKSETRDPEVVRRVNKRLDGLKTAGQELVSHGSRNRAET